MITTRDSHTLVPVAERLKPAAEQVSYLFRTPRQREKIRFRHAVAAEGGRRHGVLDLLACLRRGIEVLTEPVADDDRDPDLLAQQRQAALALVDAHREGLVSFYAQVSERAFDLETEDGRRDFDEALRGIAASDGALADLAWLVQTCYRPYARMMADTTAYADIAGMAAADLFMTGWRNKRDAAGQELRFRRGAEGLDDATLGQIPEAHFREIAAFIETLLAPSEAQVKNSGSPRPSPSAPATSQPTDLATAAATGLPPMAAPGTSSATSTSETPPSISTPPSST